MEELSLEDAAALLSVAHIENTQDLGHIVVHVGRAECETHRFVLSNDALGRSWIAWS
jgi:hypothetical protein